MVRKFKSDEIHLPFDSEYSIYIKNVYTSDLVVSFSIDNKKILEDCIIKSNEEKEIDSIDNKKFVYARKTEALEDYFGEPTDSVITVDYYFMDDGIKNTKILYLQGLRVKREFSLDSTDTPKADLVSNEVKEPLYITTDIICSDCNTINLDDPLNCLCKKHFLIRKFHKKPFPSFNSQLS